MQIIGTAEEQMAAIIMHDHEHRLMQEAAEAGGKAAGKGRGGASRGRRKGKGGRGAGRSGSGRKRTTGAILPHASPPPPPPSGVSGVGTTATAGTTAFLMNKDGDEGMEGSPSFDGGRSAGAHTAAPQRPQTRRQISVSVRASSDFGGEVDAHDV